MCAHCHHLPTGCEQNKQRVHYTLTNLYSFSFYVDRYIVDEKFSVLKEIEGWCTQWLCGNISNKLTKSSLIYHIEKKLAQWVSLSSQMCGGPQKYSITNSKTFQSEILGKNIIIY